MQILVHNLGTLRDEEFVNFVCVRMVCFLQDKIKNDYICTYERTNIHTMEGLLNTVTAQLPLWIIVGLLLIGGTIVACRFYFRKCHPIIKNAQCEAHHRTLESLESQGKTSTDTLAKLMLKIDNIERVLIAKDESLLDRFSVTHSPRQLNDAGEGLLKDSGAKVLLEAELPRLIELIDKEEPHTALDVEQISYRVLLAESGEPWFVPIKNFIYNHPVYRDTPIHVGALCFVMGISLRNSYLTRHPELLAE